MCTFHQLLQAALRNPERPFIDLDLLADSYHPKGVA